MPDLVRRVPWAWVGRIILALGQIAPGLVLIFDRSTWTNAGSLGAWSEVLPVWVFGIVMVVGGLMVLINKVQDVGCTVGAGTWGLLGLGYVVTLLAGTAISPLGLGAHPLVVLCYLWGTTEAVGSMLKREGAGQRE